MVLVSSTMTLVSVVVLVSMMMHESTGLSIDCGVRQLAHEFADELLSSRISHKADLKNVDDALRMQECSHKQTIHGVERAEKTQKKCLVEFTELLRDCEYVFYVDSVNGASRAEGSFESPLSSVHNALGLVREIPESVKVCIVLRGGTHYLRSSIRLRSNTVLTPHECEAAVLSGGELLDYQSMKWQPSKDPRHGEGVYWTKVRPGLQFTTLFNSHSNRRLTRARFPNGDPETMGRHTAPNTGLEIGSQHKWRSPKKSSRKTVQLHVTSPARTPANRYMFSSYGVGIGGVASVFEPPFSYWAQKSPAGGQTYQVPSGLYWDRAKRWSNHGQGGILHSFHQLLWGNWQFELDGGSQGIRNLVEKDQNSSDLLLFGRGGFQEARGASQGGDFYVENILEELDEAGEFYLDTKTSKLYLKPNGSIETEGAGLVAPRLAEMISIRGHPKGVAHNITIAGLTFRHSATTFMGPYAAPSGGDAAIHAGGAISVTWASNVTISGCRFDRLGGNAVFVSNYARDVQISGNEFAWIGDSAVVLLGTSQHIDGTDGRHPRGTVIENNIMREIGIYGKQASAVFQSLAADTTFRKNVMYNGPRAGVNINDGFGGGLLVEGNLGFNFVRETGDHGVFNSWDRQPYIFLVDGRPTITPKLNEIKRNLFINNYHSTWPIDHDDGSAHYLDSYNVLIYGGYKNYLGHDKVAAHNLYLYADGLKEQKKQYPWCAYSQGTVDPSPDFGDEYSNNTCISYSDVVYRFDGFSSNPKDRVPMTRNNSFFVNGEHVYLWNNNMTLEELQKMGYDIGSTVHKMPSVEDAIQMAKNLLNIKPAAKTKPSRVASS